MQGQLNHGLGSRDRQWQPLPIYRQPCVVLLAIAISAVWFDANVEPRPWFWIALGIAAGLGSLHGSARLRGMVYLVMFGAAVGSWHAWQQRAHHRDDLVIWTSEAWKPMVVRARMKSQIEHRQNDLTKSVKGHDSGWAAYVDVEIEAVRVGTVWQEASGNAQLVVNDRLDKYLHGDLVQIACHAARPAAPTNPGEPDFRPAFYASRQLVRLHAESASNVRLLAQGHWSLLRCVAWLTRRGEHALEKSVGDQYGQFASAIVLGRRGAVPEELRDSLVETGTVHLAVVSGMHLSLVAIAITWITNALGMRAKPRAIWILACCALYALATGFRPPVVRSLLLVAFMWIGRFGGRRTDSLNLLAAASLVLLLCNPAWLNQLGTQLSVLAVAGLVLAEQRMTPIVRRAEGIDALLAAKRTYVSRWLGRQWLNMRRGLWSSGCVFALTTPLIWYHFHVISTISLLANLVVSPLLLVALLSGLIATIAGVVWEPLSLPGGYVCRIMLAATDHVTVWMSDLPGSHLWIAGPSLGWILLFYGGLCVAVAITQVARCRYAMIWSAVWYLTVMVIYGLFPTYPATTEVTFVDVGHGTSVLIRPHDGLPWLYDAGRMGSVANNARPIEAVLWDARIRHLGGIVLSHADADHYSATASIIRKFRVDQIVVSPRMFLDPSPRLQSLRSAIAQAGIPICEVTTSSPPIRLSESMHAEVLHPPAGWREGNDNASSVVFHVTDIRPDQQMSLLLPGDLENEGTHRLIQQCRLTPGTIMMAPHHGSLASDPLPLVDWARPMAVIVSGGKNSLRPPVESRLRETGSDVWITARDGAVRLIWRDQGVAVHGFRHDPWSRSTLIRTGTLPRTRTQ